MSSICEESSSWGCYINSWFKGGEHPERWDMGGGGGESFFDKILIYDWGKSEDNTTSCFAIEAAVLHSLCMCVSKILTVFDKLKL